LITDVGIANLAYNCMDLIQLNIVDCPNITREGYLYLRRFCLRCLIQHSNANFYWNSQLRQHPLPSPPATCQTITLLRSCYQKKITFQILMYLIEWKLSYAEYDTEKMRLSVCVWCRSESRNSLAISNSLREIRDSGETAELRITRKRREWGKKNINAFSCWSSVTVRVIIIDNITEYL